MKIVLISPTYPSKSNPLGVTHVVHFFCKEWVKQGHSVSVFHVGTRFPLLYYWFARIFKKQINKHIDFVLNTEPPVEYDEILDGVNVYHLSLEKHIPHGIISQSQSKKITRYIIEKIESFGGADVVIGHWANPSLRLLYEIKIKTNIPTALVFHEDITYVQKMYGVQTRPYLDLINAFGFRSYSQKYNFENELGHINNEFMAFSGVSDDFLNKNKASSRVFDTITNFIFVGRLIKRKYPAETLMAVVKSYNDGTHFQMKYVGDGEESENIRKIIIESNVADSVDMLGRIPRTSIADHLKKSDVFIMISRDEIFGLVYLEAMAMGCITIAAKNEGIDGIIIDGVNGFLCKAGDVDELIKVITKIRAMNSEELKGISMRAIETANRLSDSKAAQMYIDGVQQIIKS